MNRETQELLTRIGPGTQMGALLRRYWLPVAGSSELAAGTALPVRILGEDLVVLRTRDGRVGLIAERCPHRGSSLRRGVVDAEGISCPYHGWKFDARGHCLRMPAENTDPGLLLAARTRAYPAEELGGLIFAYLGPEPRPLLPRFDLLVWGGVLRDIGRAVIPCNWLQIMENSVDPTHVEWLHGQHLSHARGAEGNELPNPYRRRHVRIGFDLFRFGIIKRRILEGGSENDEDWRIGHPLIFPLALRVGSGNQHRFQFRVPVDDTTTLHFWYACYRPPPGRPVPVQGKIPVYDVPWRSPTGDFLTDYVDGGDIMTWVMQGPIADRTSELLVSSDQGITLYRRLLREQLEAVRAGNDPMGIVRDPAENDVIELPQESEKFGRGSGFLAKSIEISHAKYSPLMPQILELLGPG
jgi:5,5'-dehydrodivanillate O-demethylase